MTFHSFDTGGIATRRLRFALVASVLLHLLLLWPTNLRPPGIEGTPALHAALRTLPAPDPIPPAKPLPRAAPLGPAPERPAAPFLEQPRVVSVPQISSPAAEKSAPPSSATPTADVRMPPAIAVEAGVATPLSEAGASGAALDGLRGYRLSVASQARRFKRYPPQATVAGWAGTTEVRLEVGLDGLPRAATVVRSSGHELLDQAALAMIDAGAQRARLPESLRGRAFAVVLPVVFNLEDD